ncbi:Sfi1 spindle body protein-domain-containing protein [Rhexocercosporidium sp. MPI-PUGE-AT-0058]|nr:Sfi1 spindle body protein-domain-containing protein [Rhexocercosporidium sp. MPI-PUGE-AT-0058]
MPPPGSSPQSNAGHTHTDAVEPYYSNEDVAILHDVVVLAQEIFPKLPERERLPTNALFGAYYDILPRIGIDTDHDNRYARVLFKIGGQRGPATLYEKFEAVLARMGIEIEFDQENREDDEESSQLEDSQVVFEHGVISDKSTPIEDKSARRQRRNSESSAWDLGIDLRSHPTTRRNSFSTIGKDHSRVFIEKEIFKRGKPIPLTVQENDALPSVLEKDETNRNVGAWLNSKSERPRRDRGRSVSTHGSMRVRRRSSSKGKEGQHHHPATTLSVPASEYDLTNSEITAATSTFEEEAVPNWTQVLVHRPAPKPEDLLGIKATLFFQARLQSLVKQKLRNWRDRAHDLQQDNVGLELIAINHDKKALSRSAFDSWRLSFLQKRKSAEKERFFAQIEQQASVLRDVYVLQRAFIHWLNYANFHVYRTAVARRHIIRTRVFNAWKDITVVNELKVRRHVVKKFFAIWRRHHTSSIDEGTSAVQKYEENLVERVYRQWVRRLWDIKAAKRWAEAIKKRALFRWIVVSHNHWEGRRSADELRQLDLAWGAWRLWKTKIEIQHRHDQEAVTHYHKQTLRGPLLKWRQETQMIPARLRVQAKVAIGTLRDVFGIWKHRARQERAAATLDRIKILREALTIWRYKFRSTIVVGRIDRRVVAEAFSKLHLRDTEISFRREQQHRRRRAIYELWKQKMEVVRERRWEQEGLARSLITRKTQTDVLHTWAFRSESKRRLETVAVEYHDPRLLRDLVTKWTTQAQHLKELERRSQDANYYLVLTKAIGQWKASTEKSKREKRKAAFAHVKRTVKVNLARGVLQNWRDQARRTLKLQSQAAEVSGNKIVILGMECFDRWRARAEELAELDILWQEQVLKKHFTTWKNRSNAVLALDTEAVLTYQENQESRAIKQWSLQALKIKAQVNYAENIHEKNAKKNFRKIFSYWRQKTIQKRPVKKVVFAESSQLGTIAKVGAWSDFGEDVEMDDWAKGLDEAGAVSTPIPGYLSTPSKRSERVMAVAARFSTTPKAPLSTPFERQLRAQWSGGAPSLRRPLARSTLGTDGGFADIPESSTNNDQEQGR